MTIRLIWNKLLLVAFATAMISGAGAQTLTGYAGSLMVGHDYFRAISAYKELAFFSKNPDSTFYFLSQAGKAYRLSEHYDLAVITFADLESGKALSASQATVVNLNIGLSYIGMHLPALAEGYLHEAERTDSVGISHLFLGLIYSENAEWKRARDQYDWIAKNTASGSAADQGRKFSAIIDQSDAIPYRSPGLATIFSAIVPGSGQLYCNHPVDALQAFGFVAAFSVASYTAYRYDHSFDHNYVLTGISVSITALFHLANILGAEKTAAYYDARQRDLFIKDIRDETLAIDF